MGILHDELAKLKAAAGRAFDFADPAAYLAEKEHEFKTALVGEFHTLEERVIALEQKIEAAFAPAQTAPGEVVVIPPQVVEQAASAPSAEPAATADPQA